MRLEAGHVLAAKMNAHRDLWNGTICTQPQSWNCGADASFRADYCDSGMSRCFHLDVFKPNAPRFVTPDSSVVLTIEQQPGLLDDQLLVFYGGRFGAQQGIVPGDYEQTLFGFYRVKRASIDTQRTPYRLIVEPHADGWAIFPRVHLRPPSLRAISGIAYLKQLRANGLKDIVEQALEATQFQSKSDSWTPDLQRRLLRAKELLPVWQQQSEQAMAKLPQPRESRALSISFGGSLEGPMAAKLKGLRIATAPAVSPAQSGRSARGSDAASDAPKPPEVREPGAAEIIEAQTPDRHDDPDSLRQERAAESPDTETTEITPPDADATAQQGSDTGRLAHAPVAEVTLGQVDDTLAQPRTGEAVPADFENTVPAATDAAPVLEIEASNAVQSVPEDAGRQVLGETFGAPLVEALSVAFITKALVILTGAPGAGKSWIASRLLDDVSRQRTVIVPVASTWRGREDLLGYVNPIHGNFEATEFTHFLCDAQHAWETGDRRSRLVIFEEFNLSQPEHWLSDLLVRLEYDPDRLADRTIRLGGNEISGRPGRSCSLVLVPSLRFVATLNNDHTVKPLSPRVLDRAALIEVTSSGRAALTRAGVNLGDEIEEVIDELNDLLEPRGAAFSVRSARSLQRAIDAGGNSGMSPARALDLVLSQEVLSRVRLLAGDPRDEQLLTRLQSWTQKPGCAELTGCAGRIGDWADLLSAGRDVFQA